MTPTPQHPRKQFPKKQSHSSVKWFIGMVILVIMIGGFGLTQLFDSSSSGVNVGTPIVTAQADDLSPAEQQKRLEPYNQSGAFDIVIYDFNESTQKMVDIPNMDSMLRVQLMEEMLNEGEIRVAEITLWDDVDQDGDVVTLSSLGYVQSVALTHTHQTFLLPIRLGHPIQITGAHDGGGGITLAFMANGQAVATPVITPNQTIDLMIF